MAAGGSNRLMGPNEMAEYLAISKKTLYAQYRTWGIPHVRVGRHLRFRVRDVEHWLEQHENQ
ncbi:helix-turn-helix domain-containing protein [Streptomyces sp. NPDC005281]|uniref:helix-turn-helix domain-containing protein n=1 Tax=Streptomyces sp. NPDC005281 TaxID=3155712 RepID=UPI0033A0720B